MSAAFPNTYFSACDSINECTQLYLIKARQNHFSNPPLNVLVINYLTNVFGNYQIHVSTSLCISGQIYNQLLWVCLSRMPSHHRLHFLRPEDTRHMVKNILPPLFLRWGYLSRLSGSVRPSCHGLGRGLVVLVTGLAVGGVPLWNGTPGWGEHPLVGRHRGGSVPWRVRQGLCCTL